MRYFMAMLASAIVAASPAWAAEPRAIGSARQVKSGLGAVRLSVQSQIQQFGTLHVWFVREGGDPAQSTDVLKFERGQGVPIAGSNMMDSKPLVYAVPPGRYVLLGHGVKCNGLPPVGTTGCSVTEYGSTYQTSAARYDGIAPAFEVVSGRLTDAGEFILEAPAGSPIDETNGFDFMRRSPGSFQVRVRPIAGPPSAVFQTLAAGPPTSLPPGFESSIQCRKRPKSASLYFPFTC